MRQIKVWIVLGFFRSSLAVLIPVVCPVTYALHWYKWGQKIRLRFSSLHPPPCLIIIQFSPSLLFLMKHIHRNKCNYKFQKVKTWNTPHRCKPPVHHFSYHKLLKANLPNLPQTLVNFLHHFYFDYDRKVFLRKGKKHHQETSVRDL